MDLEFCLTHELINTMKFLIETSKEETALVINSEGRFALLSGCSQYLVMW